MLMSEYNYEQDIEVQREEAYEEGKKLGIVAGEERYSRLLIKLSEEGKSDQILKVAHDPDLREKLYKEYHI